MKKIRDEIEEVKQALVDQIEKKHLGFVFNDGVKNEIEYLASLSESKIKYIVNGYLCSGHLILGGDLNIKVNVDFTSGALLVNFNVPEWLGNQIFEKEMGPGEAYDKATEEGPSNLTRNIACQDSYYAYWYALNVDKKPLVQTRDAACQSPYYAYRYAKYIDKQPSKQTRNAACQDPHYAYYYAKDVDKEPLQETWKYVLDTEYEKKIFKPL